MEPRRVGDPLFILNIFRPIIGNPTVNITQKRPVHVENA